MMISCKIRIKNSKFRRETSQKQLLNASRYDFEYEDDDDEETGDVSIENKYYNAKQMKADNPDEAIDEFLGLPAMEQEKGDWFVNRFKLPGTIANRFIVRGFKGLKQAIKLEFKLGRYDKVEFTAHYMVSG